MIRLLSLNTNIEVFINPRTIIGILPINDKNNTIIHFIDGTDLKVYESVRYVLEQIDKQISGKESK